MDDPLRPHDRTPHSSPFLPFALNPRGPYILDSQMVNLRSKLHLARQGRKPSLSNPSCLDNRCDPATVLTQPAGSSPNLALAPADTPPSSSASTAPRPSLEALPEEPLRRVALYCEFDDFLRLRRTCRALNHIFDTLTLLEQVLRRHVSLRSFNLPIYFEAPSIRPGICGNLDIGYLRVDHRTT